MSKIQWTERTWNPIAGCTPVSPGCLHCYAAAMSHRLEAMGNARYRGLTVLRNGILTFDSTINLGGDALMIPMKVRKPAMFFVNSMSDLFHEGVPFEFIDRVFAVMALCPRHVFQVLTKRPERMAEYLASPTVEYRIACISVAMQDDRSRFVNQCGTHGGWLLRNVWLGASVEDQQRADERIPHLLRCPAAVRFLSVEPLLGPVDLRDHLDGNPPGWVITGGESGPRARPCGVNWIRSIVAQCQAAGVPVFVKQLGSNAIQSSQGRKIKLRDRKGGDPAEWDEDLRVREWPTGERR